MPICIRVGRYTVTVDVQVKVQTQFMHFCDYVTETNTQSVIVSGCT